jgi:hypothetical protein
MRIHCDLLSRLFKHLWSLTALRIIRNHWLCIKRAAWTPGPSEFNLKCLHTGICKQIITSLTLRMSAHLCCFLKTSL